MMRSQNIVRDSEFDDSGKTFEKMIILYKNN